MEPRITFITLGVDDLERSLVFYRDGLGLKTDGILVGNEILKMAPWCYIHPRIGSETGALSP